jgi:hypothetical protein
MKDMEKGILAPILEEGEEESKRLCCNKDQCIAIFFLVLSVFLILSVLSLIIYGLWRVSQ